MADPHDYSNLEEDENNDDTFGSSMIDTGTPLGGLLRQLELLSVLHFQFLS